MSTARIPDGTPLGLVQVGLAEHRYIVPSGRSNPPVKPRSAVVAAVRAGVPPMPETERERAKRTKTMPWKWQRCSKCGRQCSRTGHGRDGLRQCPSGGVHRPGRSRGQNGCGGVQRGEIKSAGETTGGARGGSRLGDPCDEAG